MSELFQRVPELEGFTRYPSVARALKTGRAHKVYRALWWGRLLGRFKGEHRQVAKELLANRRLFIEPVTKAPGHSTVNGIGTVVWGQQELDPEDGTSIGTQFITFFFVPLFPLGQYLWFKQGDQYRVYGKVPHGPLVYLWRNLFAVLLAVGILGAAVSAWHGSRFDEVVVVNALDLDVQAEVGETRHRVPAHGRKTFTRVPVGEVPVRVDLGGELLEEGVIEVRPSNDLHAWNVGGAGLLYYQDVVYVVTGSAGSIREPDSYCGVQAVVLDDVDYLWREPPSTISMSGDREVRTHVGLWEGGWRNCLDTLVWTNPALVQGLLLATLDVQDTDDVQLLGQVLTMNQGAEETLAWTESRLAEEDSIPLHRLRQDTARGLGLDLSEEYAAAAAELQTAQSVYLHSRLLPPGDPALAVLEPALEQWPSDTWLLRSQAWNLRALGRFEEAAEAYEQLFLRLATDETLMAWAEALAGAGRHELALEKLEGLLEPDWEVLVSRGTLRAHLGRPLGRPQMKELGLSGLDLAMYEARVGAPLSQALLEKEDPGVAAAVRVIAALHTAPEGALAALAEVPVEQYHWIDAPSAVLVYGELRRSGRDDDAETFAAAYGAEWLSVVAEPDPDVVRLPHTSAAAVLFAASRQPERTEGEAAALRERAARWDFFKGLTTHAIATW